jgi:hypothetical protein
VISIFFCAPVCGFAMLSYDGSKAWVHPSVSLLRGASLSTSGPNLPSAPSTRVDAYDTRDESNERNLLDFIHPTSSRAPHAFAHPTSVLRSRPDDQAPQGFLDSAERLPKANSRRRTPVVVVVSRCSSAPQIVADARSMITAFSFSVAHRVVAVLIRRTFMASRATF